MKTITKKQLENFSQEHEKKVSSLDMGMLSQEYWNAVAAASFLLAYEPYVEVYDWQFIVDNIRMNMADDMIREFSLAYSPVDYTEALFSFINQ